METALLKCYKFSCDTSGFSAILERLTIMIRGFGEPLSAAYARLYLVHAAEQGDQIHTSPSAIVVVVLALVFNRSRCLSGN